MKLITKNAMNISRLNTIILILLVISIPSLAQTLTPRVICSGYGSGQGGGIKLNYTIGETFVTTLRNGNTVLTQGFHQPLDLPCPGAPIAEQLPENLTLECGDNVPFFDPGFFASDGSEVTVTFEEGPFGFSCAGSILQIWTAVGACADTTIVSRTIQFEDTTPPVIQCDILEFNTPCGSPIQWPDVSVQDVCSAEVEFYFTDEPVSGGCAGSTVRTYFATDACGNTSSLSVFSITIDIEAPVLYDIPTETFIACDELDNLPLVPLRYTDNCSEAVITVTSDTIAGTCPSNYDLVYTYIATDDCGNLSEYIYTVHVIDEQPPVLVFPFEQGSSACLDPNNLELSATDNCSPLEEIVIDYVQSIDAISGLFTLTIHATDACGNSSTNSFFYGLDTLQVTGQPCDDGSLCTVNDVVLEDCTCQGELYDLNNDGICDIITAFAITPSSLSFCPGDTVYLSVDQPLQTINYFWSNNAIGSTIAVVPTQSTTYSVSATIDGQTVFASVNLQALPLFEFFVDQDGDGNGSGQVALTTCDESLPGFSLNSLDCDDANPLVFPGAPCNDNNPCTFNDEYNVDCTCVGTFSGDDDDDGNCNAIDECFGVPIATNTPEDLTLACNAAIPPFDPGFYMSDGSSVFLTFNASQVTDGCTTTVIQNWIGTNDCNESTLVTRRIEFIDTQAPALLTVLPNLTVSCSDPLPGASIGDLIVTDNCSQVSISFQSVEGTELDQDVVYYIYTFTDACGNSSSFTRTIRLIDSTPPTIFYSGPTEYYLNCEDVIPTLDYSVTDNCDPEPVIVTTESSTGSSCDYTFTRVINAFDSNGNSTTLTVNYYITDVSAPEFVIPAGTTNININCTDAWPTPEYMVSDNCDSSPDITEWFTEEVTGCETIRIITIFATDNCGNVSSVDFIYRRIDTNAPVFTSTPSTVYLSCGSAVPSFIAATDNCSEVTYASSSASIPGGCTSSPNAVVTYYATDECGNTATKTVTYIFLDSASPAFVFIPEGGTYNCINDIPVEYPVAEDSCSQVGLDYWDDITQLNFGFQLTRNWSATDVCGNTALTTVLYYTQFGEIGSRCDDGNPCTYNDVVQEDCSCAGIPQVPAFGSQTIQACGPYTWNGNTYSTSGTYTFATTTAAGCDSIAQLVLTVGAPTFTNQQATACNSYQWNGSVYTQSGTYTYVTTNASGCPNTATLNLTILPTIVPTFNAAGPYCRGANIPALPTTSTNGVTGSWSPAINNQATTTYTFTPNPNQCATTASLTIVINSLSTAPTGATASSTSVPANTAVTLTVNGGNLGTGAQWRWYRSSCGGTLVGTGASISTTVTTTTTYFVRAEGTCNTTTCASVIVNVQTAGCGPTAVAATSTSICSGSSTTLSVQGSTGTSGTWKWYSGSCGGTAVGSGASVTLSPAATTTYFVRSEGGSCGTTTCLSVTITVNTAPAIPQGIVIPTNLCRNAPGVISILNPIAGLSYFWEVPNGWTITGGQGTAVLNVLVGQSNGQIRVFAFNSCGNSKRFIRSVSPINCSTQAFTTSDLDLKLWPNPTSERVFFAHGDVQPEQMQIYDMLGRDLYSGGWLPELDVSGLASGIYFVRVTSGGESVVKRMEVAR